MMHKIRIHDKSPSSNQVVLSMIFANQSVSRSTHCQLQQQKQHCNRARFFYQLRQKKKQRRLEHGPLPIHHDHLRG